MWLKLVTPPAEMPVSLAEAKANLQYSATDKDAFIASLVATATAHIEGRAGIAGRALVTQTWETRLDGFPCRYGGRIEFPLPPLQSVEWIKYVDASGVVQTIDPADYVVDAQHLIGRVRPAYNKFWPVPRCEEGSVRIQFIAGYGSAAAVPPPIKQAINLLVGHWWLNREAVGQTGGPHAFAVEALLQPYRVMPL
jgi:uncharacterized phiE125 gp8 family phage protein